MSLALCTCVLSISLMQLINGVQFSNITPLFLSSACLAANNCAALLRLFVSGSHPSILVIVIFPLTSIYA